LVHGSFCGFQNSKIDGKKYFQTCFLNYVKTEQAESKPQELTAVNPSVVCHSSAVSSGKLYEATHLPKLAPQPATTIKVFYEHILLLASGVTNRRL
jgi:hypothetical protein